MQDDEGLLERLRELLQRRPQPFLEGLTKCTGEPGAPV